VDRHRLLAGPFHSRLGRIFVRRLFNRSGDHLWTTVIVWLIALSPVVGWWLLLTGRMKHF
jgi:hypothetical protein